MPERLIDLKFDRYLETTLGELCRAGGGDIQTGPFGSQLHAADYVEVGIPSVMPQNTGDNVILDEGIARIASADAARLSRYRLEEGDIVYKYSRCRSRCASSGVNSAGYRGDSRCSRRQDRG